MSLLPFLYDWFGAKRDICFATARPLFVGKAFASSDLFLLLT